MTSQHSKLNNLKNDTFSKKVLAAQFVLLEQNKILKDIKDYNLIKLISIQNLALNLFIFMQNSLKEHYPLINAENNFIKKELKELSKIYPKEYIDIPYSIIHNLLFIKEEMTKENNTFDNKPEDIDNLLESFRTCDNLSERFNKLDQYTLSYLSDATLLFLNHFYEN